MFDHVFYWFAVMQLLLMNKMARQTTVGAVALVFRCHYSLEREQIWLENFAKAGGLNAGITLRLNEPPMQQ